MDESLKREILELCEIISDFNKSNNQKGFEPVVANIEESQEEIGAYRSPL